MSSSVEKNMQAMKALFGNDALAGRLLYTRLAVITPSDELPFSGKLLGEFLADCLGRLWPNIDFYGADAENLCSVAKTAALSGNAPHEGLVVKWAPPYEAVITIDCLAPTESPFVLKVGANDWNVAIGPDAACGESKNPVGPAFAAALAAAQIFHHIFRAELAGMDAAPINQCSIDLRALFSLSEMQVAPLFLGECHMFGVGAVSHGLLSILERWPEEVTGTLNLVDLDKYGHTNGQRYAFMKPANFEVAKVIALQERLESLHGHLEINPYPMDLNGYCAKHGYEMPLYRVISGLDSAEARRQVALKLPERTINMWTEGVRIGAGQYIPKDDAACLACDYLEDLQKPLDEVAELKMQTGIRPDLIRSLLDSGRGLTEQEASMIGNTRNIVPYSHFIGQPLRSVLPTLCATGKLTLPNNNEAVDVPFAFASLFAGITGFMMLLRDCMTNSHGSHGWTQHIFKEPTPYMFRPLHSREKCVCCAEMKYFAI